MEATVFNPIQLQLLRMFERNKSEAELREFQGVVSDYYAKKLNDHLNKLWDEGILSQEKLDEINRMNLHSWMREQRDKSVTENQLW